MRLVLPSWLVPGGWLENVEVASRLGWASGVELLFFSFEGEDRDLLLSERAGIEGILDASGLSLSVHLPDPFLPRHDELVGLFAGRAECFVLHPPRPGDLEGWAAHVSRLRAESGDRFILEYTDGGLFAAASGALPGMPICADTGRLVIEGIEPAAWIAGRASLVREIHLHGVDAEGARDHRVFTGREAWLGRLAPFLAAFPGRIELELFSLAKVEAARAALCGIKELQ